MTRTKVISLSERIRGWRAVMGWSQAALAERLGISPAAVAQWERAKDPTVPKGENLDALVFVLGTTHPEFYGDIPTPKRERINTPRKGMRAAAR